MSRSKYPEPDGYVKMRVRDFIGGAIVVSLLALAALLSLIWEKIVKKTLPRLGNESI